MPTPRGHVRYSIIEILSSVFNFLDDPTFRSVTPKIFSDVQIGTCTVSEINCVIVDIIEVDSGGSRVISNFGGDCDSDVVAGDCHV